MRMSSAFQEDSVDLVMPGAALHWFYIKVFHCVCIRMHHVARWKLLERFDLLPFAFQSGCSTMLGSSHLLESFTAAIFSLVLKVNLTEVPGKESARKEVFYFCKKSSDLSMDFKRKFTRLYFLFRIVSLRFNNWIFQAKSLKVFSYDIDSQSDIAPSTITILYNKTE